MLDNRQIFLQNLAQTSDIPLMLDVASAEGNYIYDNNGNSYLDLIAGIGVSALGHGHPKVKEAIKTQVDRHSHVMVFGEFVQQPQVTFAENLTHQLPSSLNSVYFVNSGSEAAEGAMKLAKRYTGRPKILGFQNAYHGSTQGALSLAGSESLKNSFRPLLPNVDSLKFNDFESLDKITPEVAAVVVETLQGEAGAVVPDPQFLKALATKCKEAGALLILDEIQAGMGRTGHLFAFGDYGIVPDVLLLGKALGGGMPLGAFIANREIMETLAHDPVLGHISTFGGHPMACAAGNTALNAMLEEQLVQNVQAKGERFKANLKNAPKLKEVHGKGLMMALEIGDFDLVKKLIYKLFERQIISDWFIFNNHSIRIAPPLTIQNHEIDWCSEEIKAALAELE